ncbi:MAG: diguanylate cyclase [Planctomycetes bacterium]|nr:diguanylate cyclase [Planctomycetota bacterium]
MEILIAEDDAVTRRMLQKTLENWGHRVIAAKDGGEALEAFSRGGIQLILTDWMMPVMDGPELVRQIRKTKLTSSIHAYIILLTSRNSVQDLQVGFDAGGDDFIAKPWNDIELKARVQSGVRLVELQNELERMAHTDALTSLINRRALVDSLRRDEDRMRRENRPIGVVMTDVDHFKSFNDRYGHDIGDQVLRLVGQCLAASVRGGDYVGRWGGEEFLLVLPGADIIQSAEVAERCRTLLESQRLRTRDGRVLHVTASFGAAATEGATRDDIMTLVQQADKAMYWAKDSGRNRVKIYVSSADPARRRKT